MNCVIDCAHFADWLPLQPAGETDLVLTDPPYLISRNTNFTRGGIERFQISHDFGEWDWVDFNLPEFAKLVWDTLRPGGQAIIFYDIWKLTLLADALATVGFRQLRQVEWRKTNPVPINAKTNYLANAKEMAITATKGRNPTFNSQYDAGLYAYPIPKRPTDAPHPTQKPLKLFAELVRKHSNPGDLVIDPFLGSGTTALAAIENDRHFAGCDIDADCVDTAWRRITRATAQERLELPND